MIGWWMVVYCIVKVYDWFNVHWSTTIRYGNDKLKKAIYSYNSFLVDVIEKPLIFGRDSLECIIYLRMYMCVIFFYFFFKYFMILWANIARPSYDLKRNLQVGFSYEVFSSFVCVEATWEALTGFSSCTRVIRCVAKFLHLLDWNSPIFDVYW